MKALIILILFSLLIINNVSAATIHGSVYDISLNKVKDIIIEIDSVPVQRFISNDGSYSFELSNGNYRITAKILPNTKIAEESININSDGSFNIDLFIDINIPESELLNDINEDYTKDLSIKENSNNIIKALGILIIFIIILYGFFYHKKKSKETETDDISLEVIKIIKSGGGRITQKDLRKHFPLSEAKISLVISELESKGMLKKIKKGRGNIIILNN